MTKVLGVDMPSWAGKAISAIGISTIFYGIVRYTFVGEFLEKLYRNATGKEAEVASVDDADIEVQIFKADGKLMRDRQN